MIANTIGSTLLAAGLTGIVMLQPTAPNTVPGTSAIHQDTGDEAIDRLLRDIEAILADADRQKADAAETIDVVIEGLGDVDVDADVEIDMDELQDLNIEVEDLLRGELADLEIKLEHLGPKIEAKLQDLDLIGLKHLAQLDKHTQRIRLGDLQGHLKHIELGELQDYLQGIDLGNLKEHLRHIELGELHEHLQKIDLGELKELDVHLQPHVQEVIELHVKPHLQQHLKLHGKVGEGMELSPEVLHEIKLEMVPELLQELKIDLKLEGQDRALITDLPMLQGVIAAQGSGHENLAKALHEIERELDSIAAATQDVDATEEQRHRVRVLSRRAEELAATAQRVRERVQINEHEHGGQKVDVIQVKPSQVHVSPDANNRLAVALALSSQAGAPARVKELEGHIARIAGQDGQDKETIARLREEIARLRAELERRRAATDEGQGRGEVQAETQRRGAQERIERAQQQAVRERVRIEQQRARELAERNAARQRERAETQDLRVRERAQERDQNPLRIRQQPPRPRPDTGGAAPQPPAPPAPPHANIQRAMERLERAMHELQERGMHEQARELAERARRLGVPPAPPAHGRAEQAPESETYRSGALRRAAPAGDLQQQVNQLRNEVAELRRMVRQLSAKIDELSEQRRRPAGGVGSGSGGGGVMRSPAIAGVPGIASGGGGVMTGPRASGRIPGSGGGSGVMRPRTPSPDSSPASPAPPPSRIRSVPPAPVAPALPGAPPATGPTGAGPNGAPRLRNADSADEAPPAAPPAGPPPTAEEAEIASTTSGN